MFRVAASLVRRDGRLVVADEFSVVFLILTRERSSSRSFRAASRVIFLGESRSELELLLTAFFWLTMTAIDLRRV